MRRSATETTVEPSKGWQFPDFAEIVQYRDLLKFLVMRDIKVRYRQTLLGVVWAVLLPLLTMAMMSVVFGKMLGVASDGVPYPLFCFAGLVLWTYFSQALTAVSVSVTSHVQMIEKVYFPRLLIPLASALSALVNLGISFVLLLLIMLIYRVTPSIAMLFCLPVLLLTILLAIGIGSALAAMSVRYRDVSHLVPFLVQLWLFASPVIYSSNMVTGPLRIVLAINPMTGLIEMFRWSLLGTDMDPLGLFALSSAIVLVILPLGLLVFRRLERGFADVI